MDKVNEAKSKADGAFKAKDYFEAVELYTEAINLRKEVQDVDADPKLFVLYNNRSATYRNLRFASLALEDAEESLRLDGSVANARGWQRKGNAHRTLGQMQQAEMAFKQSLTLNPALDAASIQETLSELRAVRPQIEKMVRDWEKKLARSTDMKKNLEDPFGSGDQSDVKGLPRSEMPGGIAADLREVWSGGANFSPTEPFMGHSDMVYHCYIGNVKHVKYLVGLCNGDEDKISQLVNRRESLLRLGPLFAAVCGTRNPRPAACGDGKGCLEVAKYLILNYADVNAKDVAGYSIVHHCSTQYATSLTLELLPMLFERGADFGAFNRMGDGAISEPCMTGNKDAVKGLIQFGADPTNPSKSGRINLNMLPGTMGNAPMQQLLAKAAGFRGLKIGEKVTLDPPVKVRFGDATKTVNSGKISTISALKYEVEVEAEGDSSNGSPSLSYISVDCDKVVRLTKSLSNCQNCGKPDAMMVCGSCKISKYCGATCQKAHWKTHKKECKKGGGAAAGGGANSPWVISAPSAKEGMNYVADVSLGSVGSTSKKGGGVMDNRKMLEQSKKMTIDDMVIKVQVPLDLNAGKDADMQAMVAKMMGLPTPSASSKKSSSTTSSSSSGGGDILIYDQHKRINWYLGADDCPPGVYDEICSEIRTSGVQKAKQYYMASLKEGKLQINRRALGPQSF